MRSVSLALIKPAGLWKTRHWISRRDYRFQTSSQRFGGFGRVDDEGFIYALTSHSRTRKGNRSPDREHLMRFKIQDGNVLGLTSYDNLTQVLETDHKLHDLIRERTKAEVSFEEINIEGMAFDPVKNVLFWDSVILSSTTWL